MTDEERIKLLTESDLSEALQIAMMDLANLRNDLPRLKQQWQQDLIREVEELTRKVSELEGELAATSEALSSFSYPFNPGAPNYKAKAKRLQEDNTRLKRYVESMAEVLTLGQLRDCGVPFHLVSSQWDEDD